MGDMICQVIVEGTPCGRLASWLASPWMLAQKPEIQTTKIEFRMTRICSKHYFDLGFDKTRQKEMFIGVLRSIMKKDNIIPDEEIEQRLEKAIKVYDEIMIFG